MTVGIEFERRSAASKVRGEKTRQAAIEGYFKNPNICKNCQQPIPLSKGLSVVSTARAKKFCNHTCAAKYNNLGANSPNRLRAKPPKLCDMCDQRIERKSTRCMPCRSIASKERIENSSRIGVVRTVLSEHARSVLFRDGIIPCVMCGYTFVVEAAHLKAVKDFPRNAIIKEVNDRSNLVPLCPNHHLEFDRGKLSLTDLLDRVSNGTELHC